MGNVFVCSPGAGIDASCSMGCGRVRSATVSVGCSCSLTRKLANDCLANWLRCPCDDANKPVKLAVGSIR